MTGNISGIFAIILWSIGTTFVFLTGDISPFILSFLSFLSFGIAGLCLLFFNVFRKEKFEVLKTISLSDYSLAFSGIFVYTIFLYISFKTINPIEANILNYFWPILLGVLIAIDRGVKHTLIPLIGLFIGFIGTAILFYDGNAFLNVEMLKAGHFLAFLAALTWAIYSWKAQKRQYPQIIFIPVLLVSSLICLVLEYALFNPVWPSNFEWVAAFILGFLRLSYVFWDHGIRNGNALFLSSLSYLIPLFSFFFLCLAGAQNSSPYVLVSVVLITMGCVISNFSKIKEWFKK